jgi:cytochrome c biogenesis factor
MLKFFLSTKTYLWLTGISIGSFLIGSFYIPNNLAIFSGINDMPLFSWLSQNNNDLDKFIWIYLLIGLMLLLWICTLICSLDAIIKRTTRKQLVRILSPQILHAAILFVLIGYVVSASTGYKLDIPMNMDDTQEVKGFDLKVDDMEFFTNPGESSTRWRVHLRINNELHKLEVGQPSFYNSVGFFAKSAQKKKKSAIIGLIYDPGVIWEMIGAVTFIIGAAGIFITRFNDKLPSGG